MVTEYNSLDERSLSIYEYDMVNGGKALILKVYCTKRDNGVWELPAPQIFNDAVYQNNKANYDDAVQAFRNDCVGNVDQKLSNGHYAHFVLSYGFCLHERFFLSNPQ